MNIEVHPLTKDRWTDLVELFGRPGASIVRGCWCMYYRKTGPSGIGPGQANRTAMKSLVDGGSVPGLIGYQDGTPVGWVSLGPREDYPKLQRSPVMKPVDDTPVWSIICFFVDSRYGEQEGRPRDRGAGRPAEGRRVIERATSMACVTWVVRSASP